jgi:hypothetical protein
MRRWRYGDVAGAAAAAALAVSFLWVKSRCCSTSKKRPDDEILIELFKMEKALYTRDEPPISTLTWFQGDYRNAAAILENRVALIVQANPWLGGNIVKRGSGNTLYLAYSSTKRLKSSDFFTCLDPNDSPIARETPLFQLADLAKQCLLKNGKNQPLFKVSLLPCQTNPNTAFAVVVVVSHLAGDGHTFYQIHNMLCSQEPVFGLLAKRISETTPLQKKALSREVDGCVLQSVPTLVNLVYGFIRSKTVGPATQARIILLDPPAMQQAKLDAAVDVPFVSTNDVVTSWFLQHTQCTNGFMILNFRNRLPGHTDRHAGNYMNYMYFGRPDSERPNLIRQSLHTLKRIVTNHQMPSWWDCLTGSTAMITNWASFANANFIEGCVEDLHVPLVSDIAAKVPTTMALCVVFRSGPRGLGLLMAATPDKLKGLRAWPCLSAKSLEK